MKIAMMTATAALLATPALAAPVDLSTWTDETLNNSGSNWTVQGVGNDTVFQSVNGNPTVFFEAGANDQGTSLSGQITVETSGDDDFIGFVLGYQPGELNSASADFLLIDWKQNDQSPAVDGLAISRVTGDAGATPEDDYWDHSGVVQELQRGSTLGSTGWLDNTTYTFDLEFTSSLIRVFVDGGLELSLTAAQAGLGSFGDGSFGFYNYSQSSVRYAGITEDIVPDPDPTPVPAPGALGLIGLGILGLGALRRRR
ncbi:PEP-CTERM sorting domain-containing protein [Pacificimonas sp. ICDLI1SI03]